MFAGMCGQELECEERFCQKASLPDLTDVIPSHTTVIITTIMTYPRLLL